MQLHKVDGRYSLTFSCSNPVDPAIEAAGYVPNGYFWDGVVQFGFPKAGKLEFDSEGSMFCALGRRRTLARLEQFLTPLVGSAVAISALIAEAERRGFVFDD